MNYVIIKYCNINDNVRVLILRPYSKSKLELNLRKSNLDEAKIFVFIFIFLFCPLEGFRNLSLDFSRSSWGTIEVKFAIEELRTKNT